jgi:hypothetical protein
MRDESMSDQPMRDEMMQEHSMSNQPRLDQQVKRQLSLSVIRQNADSSLPPSRCPTLGLFPSTQSLCPQSVTQYPPNVNKKAQPLLDVSSKILHQHMLQSFVSGPSDDHQKWKSMHKASAPNNCARKMGKSSSSLAHIVSEGDESPERRVYSILTAARAP